MTKAHTALNKCHVGWHFSFPAQLSIDWL